MSQPTRVVVTGGAGFIGSHVVDALRNAGFDVLVLGLTKKPHRGDVAFVTVNVTDFDAVLDACQGARYVYHLAGISNVDHATAMPGKTVATNILGTANVLEAARRNKVERLIFASTVWVYSACRDSVVTEASPLQIQEVAHVYTASKVASELLCYSYSQLYGQPVTVLRYGIPYGPRMRAELVIARFVKQALAGQPLTIAGDGSQVRDFVYVEDLARAHVLATQEIAKNQTYNLAGGQPTTILEVAATVRRLLGDMRIEYTASRSADYGGQTVSSARAREQLGWEPAIGLNEGILRTVEWFRQTNEFE